MIQKISVCNSDDLIPWRLDLNKFRNKYSSIYDIHKKNLSEMDFSEIEDILPQGENLLEVTANIESVILYFSDETTVSILNTDLIKWHGIYCDGYSIYSDEHFVYFIISYAYGQAGSLGIWSINDREWIFNRSDETFCVEAVVYSESTGIFIGISHWNYPMTPYGGEDFFIVKCDGSYIEVYLEQAKESDFSDISTKICRKFMNLDNHYLCFDEIKSLVVTIRGNKKSVYKLNDQQDI